MGFLLFLGDATQWISLAPGGLALWMRLKAFPVPKELFAVSIALVATWLLDSVAVLTLSIEPNSWWIPWVSGPIEITILALGMLEGKLRRLPLVVYGMLAMDVGLVFAGVESFSSPPALVTGLGWTVLAVTVFRYSKSRASMALATYCLTGAFYISTGSYFVASAEWVFWSGWGAYLAARWALVFKISVVALQQMKRSKHLAGLSLSQRIEFDSEFSLATHDMASTGKILKEAVGHRLTQMNRPEMVRVLESQLSDPSTIVDVSHLAQQVGVDPRTCVRAFKRARLPSPRDFYKLVLLVHAREMLVADPNMSGPAAARALGVDTRTLKRYSKAIMGVEPERLAELKRSALIEKLLP